MIDSASGRIVVYSGQVPETLRRHWLICQLELYVMVELRWSLKNLFLNRRTIWWVDNEAARFSLIKRSKWQRVDEQIGEAILLPRQ